MLKKYTFHVTGTHCASCKILIEDILKEQDFVKNARVDLKKEIVEIETDNNQDAEEVATFLTNKLKPNNYILSVEKRLIEKENDLSAQADEKEGRVSYAFRLVFQSMERTLTDEEVNVLMKKISLESYTDWACIFSALFSITEIGNSQSRYWGQNYTGNKLYYRAHCFGFQLPGYRRGFGFISLGESIAG